MTDPRVVAAGSPPKSCKTCAWFGQTYKHDIEREDHAYQEGSCSAQPWVRVGGPHVPIWTTSVFVDRDDVRACHTTQRPVAISRGFF